MRVPLDVPPAGWPVRRTSISTLYLGTLVLRQKERKDLFKLKVYILNCYECVQSIVKAKT